MSISPFYIGQKVVLIATGNIYNVVYQEQVKCGCWVVELNDAPDLLDGNLHCDIHNISGISGKNFKNVPYYSTSLRPLEEKPFPAMKIENKKILEETTELISLN